MTSVVGVSVFAENDPMMRRAILAGFLTAFCLALGCEGGNSKDTNPNNLAYSKDGPPKRDGVKAGKKK
jgi:hypothetical protein